MIEGLSSGVGQKRFLDPKVQAAWADLTRVSAECGSRRLKGEVTEEALSDYTRTWESFLLAARQSFGPLPESDPPRVRETSGLERAKSRESEARVPKVLVVDDDPDLLESLLDHLGQRGYAAEGAASVRGARFHLDRNDFDAAIFDINLRGESGLDLLENVQADKELSVIIMTGMPSTDTAIRALRNRAEDYLQKPFELESLDESLERILKRRGRELNLRD